MTQAQVLIDTVEFYGEDLERRATEGLSCVYETEDKRRCAIGRLCPEIAGTLPYSGVGRIWKRLPEQVKELGVDFLFQVQLIHDRKDNWSDWEIMSERVVAALNSMTDPSSITSLFIGPFGE